MKLKGNTKACSISITTILAICGLGLSIYNTIAANYRPMAMSIEVLGFIGPEKDLGNPVVAAHLVFSNLGKRNIAIAGVFLEIQNPSDSNNVFIASWVSGSHGAKALPSIVPAEQTLLKTIAFEGPSSYELEEMPRLSKAKEIEATIIVTVVGKHGDLMDIRFKSIRFLLDSKGKYSGYVFDSKSSIATLNDAIKNNSIMHRFPPGSMLDIEY